MRTIDKLHNSLFFHVLLILSGWLLFKKPLEEGFVDKLIIPVLSSIESSVRTDIILICLFFYLIIYFYFKRNILVISDRVMSVMLSISLLYLAYRFNYLNGYSPISFSILNLSYADLIPLITTVTFLPIWVINKESRMNQSSSGSLLFDSPIKKPSEDTMRFDNYAARIAGEINGLSNTDSAFAIGINSEWGTGKTSFINLIIHHLDRKETIVTSFNAWGNDSAHLIVKSFFNNLYKAIKPHKRIVADSISHYANTIVENRKPTLLRTIIQLSQGNEQTQYERFMKSNEAIRNSNLKIVIVIDDLDRLDTAEIVEVFKLIRNTANFRNTIFLVAYDSAYLESAIRKMNEHKAKRFLEKIFQLEVNLPAIRQEDLYKSLSENLLKSFPEYTTEIDDLISNSHPEMSPLKKWRWLQTLRDVFRLVNTIKMTLELLKGEVDFDDFFNLQLLRVFHPKVYQLLSDNSSRYLEIGQYPIHYCLTKTEKSMTSISLFEADLKDNLEEFELRRLDLEKIMVLMYEIFPKNSRWKHTSLSVYIPSQFNKYFNYDLLSKDLSEVEFSRVRRTYDLKEFTSKISQWIEEGKKTDLVHKLEKIISYDSKEDFENIIKGTIFIGNHNSKNDYEYGYDPKDIYSKLQLTRNIDYFYSGKKHLYKEFVRGLFEDAPPFSYEFEMINQLFYHFTDFNNFVFKKDELENLLLLGLLKALDSKESFDLELWGAIRTCYINYFEQESANTFKRVQKLISVSREPLKSFLKSKPSNDFLIGSIGFNIPNKKSYKLGIIIKELFTNLDDLDSFLANEICAEPELTAEFREFVIKQKNNPSLEYVEFEFNSLQLVDNKLKLVRSTDPELRPT